jgi:uncharacterized protein
VALVLDTGPLLASLDRDDPDHAACALLLHGREPMVVPEPVLAELDYWCVAKRLGDGFDQVLRDVQRHVLAVERVVEDDLVRILELRADYRDLRVGYVDAAVLAIVERLGERKLATLDRRHFAVMRPRHVAALELLPA